MKKTVWKGLFILGLLVLIGTAGANDVGTVSAVRLVLQAVAGAVLIFAAGFRAGLFSEEAGK